MIPRCDTLWLCLSTHIFRTGKYYVLYDESSEDGELGSWHEPGSAPFWQAPNLSAVHGP